MNFFAHKALGGRLLDSALVISVATFLGYALDYLYEVEYLRYFNITGIVHFELERVVIIAVIAIGFMLFLFAVVQVFSYLFSLKLRFFQNRFVRAVLISLAIASAVGLLAVALPDAPLSSARGQHAFKAVWNVLVGWTIIISVIVLVVRRVPQLAAFRMWFSQWYRAMRRILRARRQWLIIAGVLLYSFLIFFSWPGGVGRLMARNQDTAYMLTINNETFVVIRQYSDFWLAKPYHPATAAFGPGYQYINTKELSSVKLTPVYIKTP